MPVHATDELKFGLKRRPFFVRFRNHYRWARSIGLPFWQCVRHAYFCLK